MTTTGPGGVVIRMEKIEEGWYKTLGGFILKKWWSRKNSPKNKAGWYFWQEGKPTNSPVGPFKTRKECLKRFYSIPAPAAEVKEEAC